MVLASSSSTAHSAPSPDAARRATAACGLSFVILFVLGTVLTTTGPLPNGQVESEAARMASQGGDIRLAGLFGLFATLSFAGFALGLGMLAFARRAAAAAAVSAGGGLIFGAVWIVSFAAVVASAQAAQTGLSADATMAMGHLHSVSLLLGFAPAGVVLLSSAAARLWGRTLTVAAVLIGVAAMTASATLLSVDLDSGPLAALVATSFLGIPVWVTAAAITLLRRRSKTLVRADTLAQHVAG
jgi:hypothetical protein